MRRTSRSTGASPRPAPEEDRTRLAEAGHTLAREEGAVDDADIRETIVTTVDSAGKVHIAPLGIIAERDGWIIAPFRPSTTLDNLAEVPFAVANYTDDVRIFAGCLTGRARLADRCRRRLSGAAACGGARAFGAAGRERRRRRLRPRHFCRVMREETHAPFTGFNRAQAAVLELAILVSRLRHAAAREDRSGDRLSRDRHRKDRRPRRRGGLGLADATESADHFASGDSSGQAAQGSERHNGDPDSALRSIIPRSNATATPARQCSLRCEPRRRPE